MSGEIEVSHGDDDPSPRRYTLKPLGELYGQGNPDEPLDPQSHTFGPLFLAIEEEASRSYRCDPTMTDGTVGLALELLAMNPGADVQHDVLARRIQLALRMCLSLNDYSRDEVRQALRKVRKSVDRHTRTAGHRGYLDFIRQYLPA